MNKFKEDFEKIYLNIDARTPRERALLLITVLVTIIFIWNMVIFGPLSSSKRKAETDRQRLDQNLKEIQVKIEVAMEDMKTDPSKELKAKKEKIKQQISKADSELSDLTSNLISPKEMAHVLQEVLKRIPNLTLEKLENLPPIALVNKQQASANGEVSSPSAIELYKHGLAIEFSGQYFSTLFYLKMLEGLGVRFIWESLDYAVKDYPAATIKLIVRTLSKQEGLLGD